MIVWHFSMQGEDVIEHTNDKPHVFYILVCKEIFLSLLSFVQVSFVYTFSQLVGHCVT